MKHVNIPIFIPHLGCPHTCVFCNQCTISGASTFDPATAEEQIIKALSTIDSDTACEIAYFGGSFTGIDRGLMIYLLDVAEKFVRCGRVAGIRCSTRPDYISRDIAEILSRYTISTVELGVQSMSDAVLSASQRGHTPEDTRRAAALLHEYNIKSGGQMMMGLPRSTPADEEECARAICSLGFKEARVYPTIVFYGTKLAAMWRRGEYEPLTLEDAVERTANVLQILDAGGVKVLRVGLCDNENLHSGEYEAGPNHPAIGELAASRVYYKKIKDALSGADIAGKDVEIYVPRGAVSKAVGQHKCNRDKIIAEYKPRSLRFIARDATRENNTVYSVENKTVN